MVVPLAVFSAKEPEAREEDRVIVSLTSETVIVRLLSTELVPSEAVKVMV